MRPPGNAFAKFSRNDCTSATVWRWPSSSPTLRSRDTSIWLTRITETKVMTRLPSSGCFVGRLAFRLAYEDRLAQPAQASPKIKIKQASELQSILLLNLQGKQGPEMRLRRQHFPGDFRTARVMAVQGWSVSSFMQVVLFEEFHDAHRRAGGEHVRAGMNERDHRCIQF